MVDPVTGLTLVKAVAETTKKLYDVAIGLKDHAAKQKVDEILDELRALKHVASQLEDDNRALREKLRFKSDQYSFTNPFWYEKGHPEQPLCPKCFTKDIAAPMTDQKGSNTKYRNCLVCGLLVNEGRDGTSSHGFTVGNGPQSWMR